LRHEINRITKVDDAIQCENGKLDPFARPNTLRHQQQVDRWPFDLESGVRVTCVTWATSVPILVFLGLSVLELYARCTRQTDVRQKHRLMSPPYGGGGIITVSLRV